MKEHGTVAAAGRALGFKPSTFSNRVERAREAGFVARPEPAQDIEHFAFPDDDVPVETILSTMSKRFTKRQEYNKAKVWFPVKINHSLPCVFAFWGDPHLGANGCNVPLLERDVALCRDNEGVYGVNLGDVTDNWGGRLIVNYARSDSSQKTDYKLAKWFLKDSGIIWAIWILGNHDEWNDGAQIWAEISENIIECHDWQARFKIVFQNGKECPIWAAHSFKGNSIWNTLHGPLRAAKFSGAMAKLYIQGHHHEWALHETEDEQSGNTFWLGKARGYKHVDNWGERHGFFPPQHGSTIAAVIDPMANPDSPAFIRCYPDLEQAVDFMKYLRAR